MVKTLTKYLLTFGFLLIGYFCLRSKPAQEYSLPAKAFGWSEFSHSRQDLNCQLSAGIKALPDQKVNVKTDSEENVEEISKSLFSKTDLDINDYFTSFHKKLFSDFRSGIKNRLPVFEHWFYTSSRRYITLQIMKI